MSEATIEQRVLKIIEEQFGTDEDITPKTDLKKLNIDSLDQVELVMEFEAEFGIKISDEEESELYTENNAPVSKIIAYVEKKVTEYSK